MTWLEAKLDGWKTHLLALCWISLAVGCWKAGMLTGPQAYEQIGIALFGSALRGSVSKAAQ